MERDTQHQSGFADKDVEQTFSQHPSPEHIMDYAGLWVGMRTISDAREVVVAGHSLAEVREHPDSLPTDIAFHVPLPDQKRFLLAA